MNRVKNMENSFEKIRQIALETGWLDCGAVTVDPPVRSSFTPLEFLPSPLSRNKKDLLHDARSILVFLWPYDKIAAQQTGAPVTASAQGRDYHLLLREKLEPVVAYLESLGESVAVQIDTGPLEERPFADACGLGYIGKNGQFIHTQGGSYVFIALIATSGTYETQKKEQDTCGSCTRCIKACPTRAIQENEVIASKCLSYLTQKKEADKEELRSITTAYGCDICSLVCPKNRHLPLKKEEGIPFAEMTLSNREMKIKYKDHAVFWRGPAIIKRNMLLALFNKDAQEAVSYAKKLKDNDSHLIRRAVQIILEDDHGNL